MYRFGRYRVLASLSGLPLAGFANGGGAGGSSAAGDLPKDPCALLTPAEVAAAVAPGSKIGAGVPDNSAAPVAVRCSYTWGPRTSQWGESSVTITVMDANKAWPGLSAEQIQQGVLIGSRSPGDSSSPVPGVGDAAAFTFRSRSHDARAEAVFSKKAEHVTVEFHGGGDTRSKDQVVRLLKQAAARL